MQTLARSNREVIAVIAEEISPVPEPANVLARLAHLPYPIALESVDVSADRGRYSYFTADPIRWIRRTIDEVVAHDPFAELAEELVGFRTESIPELPPFQGGIAGLFAYDLCHAVERVPRSRIDEFACPALAVGIYDWVLAYDHLRGRAWIISTGYPETHPTANRDRAEERIHQVHQWLNARQAPEVASRFASEPITPRSAMNPLPNREGVFSSFSRSQYLEAVARAVEYVHAGDCFQVNVSQRLIALMKGNAVELYERSRMRNPAPFASYLDLGDIQIVSASPERFLQVTDGMVETRPIKGTRPRGNTSEESAAHIRDLLASPKDRAENVMIVDLLRNDLGRVCEYGSVRVPTVCTVETYRHVHHLISVVRGRLRDDAGPLELLRAAFPGGSVTGAPKVRAMEIIAELEPTARGPYCGSMGFIGFNRSMDTNILIRTFMIAGGWVQFPVGGGIVADSNPVSEYEETLHKAEGLLRSLE